MAQTSIRAWIAADGRLDIPAEQRKVLGMENGGAVALEAVDGQLTIRPVDRVLASVQAAVRAHLPAGSGTSVDQFIERRREEERLAQGRLERLSSES
jgi:bifunctional DNA-binding transcriptional regulator/antitoxin component of YhaV-PrlF toxin-antitoxin module